MKEIIFVVIFLIIGFSTMLGYEPKRSISDKDIVILLTLGIAFIVTEIMQIKKLLNEIRDNTKKDL